MNSFMDVSIGKQSIKMMKKNFFWHKKLLKSRRLVHLCKNMIISFCITFFAKIVACNDAHKDQKIQSKNKKLSKSRRVMYFWVYILKSQKVVTLKYCEKTPTLDTFGVRHRGVKRLKKDFICLQATKSFKKHRLRVALFVSEHVPWFRRPKFQKSK